MPKESLVKNAADSEQVKKAENKEKFNREKELRDLASILQEPQGRRFIWRLLEHCKLFESIQKQSAEIHYLSGIRDIGLFILSEVNDADQVAFFKMMVESQKENNPEMFNKIMKRLKEEI